MNRLVTNGMVEPERAGEATMTATKGETLAQPRTVKRIPLPEIARTFFVLGVLGFGGPAAHIALMESELVTRRGWLDRQYFLELFAAINLVPGPNSTEMALQIGYLIGGVPGLLLAGAGFIVPASVLSALLAAIYVQAGSLPAVQGLLLGVKPVVLVLILSAAYRLGQKAIDNREMRVLMVFALAIVLIGNSSLMFFFGYSPIMIPELVILLTTGALYILWRRAQTLSLILPVIGVAGRALADTQQAAPGLFDLFWRFFVIGGTLFGSGYVLAAYMQRTFVDGLHWLTPQQLINVLAIGQATPGPLLSTASATGYLVTARVGDAWSGVPGAIAATLGVFLPAFIVVLILGYIVPLLRRYPVVMDFLKGVNAGVIALLIGAFVTLASATLFRADNAPDWLSLVLTGVAFVLLERYRWSPLTLIVVGAAVGIMRVVLGIS